MDFGSCVQLEETPPWFGEKAAAGSATESALAVVGKEGEVV